MFVYAFWAAWKVEENGNLEISYGYKVSPALSATPLQAPNLWWKYEKDTSKYK